MIEKQKNKGITLIALVVTIVVLLILAAVSISMLSGENGIIKQATQSKENTNREGAREKFNLVVTNVKAGKMEKNEKFLLSDSLAQEIESYNEIESATFTGEKIEVVVDGYTFEVTGDIENSNGIVEGDVADWDYYIDTDGYAVLTLYKKENTTKLVVPNYIDGAYVKK